MSESGGENSGVSLIASDTRTRSHIEPLSQTITRAAVTYKRNRLTDQWAERGARQQTASVARIRAAHGRAGREGWRVRCPYFLRGARAEPLQQPAQDHPIFQGALQERLGIRDGLLRRLQHPESNEPRNCLFRRIHVQSQQIRVDKSGCVWGISTAYRPGYAAIRALGQTH